MENRKKLSALQTALIAFVVLLLLSCVCVSLIVATKDASQVTPVPTRTPPVHTPTARPSVANTQPAKIPTHSPTATDDGSAVYLAKVQYMMLACQENILALADQSQKVSDNSYILLDDTWHSTTDGILDDILDTCAAIADVSPVPASLETFHSYIFMMSEEMSQMADDMRKGVDDINADLIIGATGHLNKAMEYMNKAMGFLPK